MDGPGQWLGDQAMAGRLVESRRPKKIDRATQKDPELSNTGVLGAEDSVELS